VIEAFYAGLETVHLEDFDYGCKLDMDLDLPVRYFELLIERMGSDPRVGTTSGKPWFIHPESGALMPEVCGDEMSVGMTKFYRIACFKEIGGFVSQVMWDGIDCHRARMLGWIAESVDREPLRFIHLRPQGASPRRALDGTASEGIWPILHGHVAPVSSCGGGLSPAGLPGAHREPGHAVGFISGVGSRACRATTISKVQRASSALTSTLPPHGQAGRHGPDQRRAGLPLACSHPPLPHPDERQRAPLSP